MITESVVEDTAIAWLESTGWQVAHGPDVAPDMPVTERRDAGDHALAGAHMPKRQEARP
jgi:type I restriction enzyme, R subunit